MSALRGPLVTLTRKARWISEHPGLPSPLFYHLNSLFQEETKLVELKAPMKMSSRR